MSDRWKKRLKKWGIGILVVLASMGIWYVAADREDVVLDAKTRAAAGGTYATLALGVTHYELAGDPNGPVVVMLHGSTVSIWDFDLQMQPLLQAGFRVLRFDALGRGLSDRPPIDYTKQVLVQQLEQLLNYLKITEPVLLLGHSLGGATAVQFAVQHPQRVRGLALISPVINSVHSAPPFFVCNTPVLGEFLLRVGMIRVLHTRANMQWDGAGVDMSHYDALFARQISIKGFEHAVCSMFQTDLVGDYRDAYRRLGQLHLPGWIAYGTEDVAIWPTEVEALKPVLPRFRFSKFENGGHSIHVQFQDPYNLELINFFNSL